MEIIDHGFFFPYLPTVERQRELDVVAADPETGTGGVLFSRNQQGQDFYDLEFDGFFALGAILASADATGRIVGLSFAGTGVVPRKDCRLYELRGDELPAALEELSGRVINLGEQKLE